MGEMLGTHLDVEITGVAHGGVFVARHEGRVVFVRDAIPGESVRVEVTDDSKKSFWRADTVGVLEPSEHRRPHVWASADIDRAPVDRPGGAEFGHIALPHQRELKRLVVRDALSRMAGIEADVSVEALPSGRSVVPEVEHDGAGWRTRVRLQVSADGRPGPFAERSHRVILVEDLPLAVPEAQAIAPLGESFPGADFIDIVVPSVGNPYVLVGSRPSARRGAPDRPTAGSTRRRASAIIERVGDREFRLDARGFWQVHRHAAATLTLAVQSAVDESRFDPDAANLDLYGGVGLFSAAVADRFGRSVRITSVESDASATGHAEANLADLPGANAVTSRVERHLAHLRATESGAERERIRRGTVILDPPRSGAGAAVIDELAELAPAQLVYVACDPVALARDLARLRARGYELTRLRAWDLFPNTHHVEAIATLARA